MKTILKRIFSSQGGFTLIELLAVLGIIAVLAGITTAAVSGTKGASTESQVASDGNALGKASTNYQIKANEFPDQALSASVDFSALIGLGGKDGVAVNLQDKEGFAIGTLADLSKSADGSFVPSRRAINFAATTRAHGDDGKIRSFVFVPDLLAAQPKSLILEGTASANLDDNPLLDFMWAYRVTSPGAKDSENRQVEVYKLKSAVCVVSSYTIGDGTLTTKRDLVVAKQTKLNDALIGVSPGTGLLAQAHTYTSVTLPDDGHRSTDTFTTSTNGVGSGTNGGLSADGSGAHSGTAHTSTGTAVGDPSLAKATRTLAEKQKTLGDKKVELERSIKNQDSVATVATKTNDVAVAAREVTSAEIALFKAKAMVATDQEAVSSAASDFASEQGTQTTAATNTNQGCKGSNKVYSVTYKRIFD